MFGTLRPAPFHAAEDRQLSPVMRACWVQFARAGDPNRTGLPAWPRYTAAADEYLEFGDPLRVGRGLERELYDLLERALRERRGRSPESGGPEG